MILAGFLLISQTLCQAGPMMPPTVVPPGPPSAVGAAITPSQPSGEAGTPPDPAGPSLRIGSGEPADAAATGTSELQPEASPLDFKLSPDGTVATILFDRESAEAMRNLVSQLEQTGALGKVRGIIYSAAGFTPMLILMGEKEELHQKLLLLKRFIPDQNQAHMVVISASLRELSDDDAMNIGLTLSPDIIGATISTSAGMLFQSSEPAQYSVSGSADLNSVSFAKIAQLNQALDRSKVLVSSEVYTRNGTKALLTNIQQVPIFSTDFNNNVMTSYQQLETSVDVIPTTIDYRKDKPEESQVRVDVLVKISVVTANHTYNATTTAPEYTTKTFATTRVLKANNARYVVGTFVNDAEYREQVGIPFLSKIPIVKYLFSRDGKRTVRNVAILTLAVRLIPMQVKDLTIDTEHINPLEELYKKKGSLKDAK
jgi:type II secretory pathway component GspD/PulD (secretin)